MPLLFLDGAIATELEYRGADLRDPLWSARALIEQPELIRQVHYDYFVAGADIATTATYQATFPGFARRGIEAKAAAGLMRTAVQLAIEARAAFWQKTENRKGRRYPLVAASIGPYGAFLADGSEYRGNYGLSVRELMDFHRPRLNVLADTEADLLALETIPCQEEIAALIRLLEECATPPAWLSCQCRDDLRIAQGEPFEACVQLIRNSKQVIAVGVNCCPPDIVTPLLKKAASVTDKPLVAYPNSGEQWSAAGHCWLPADHATDLRILAPEWYAVGARFIGGCCRTRPRDIRAIREAVEQ